MKVRIAVRGAWTGCILVAGMLLLALVAAGCGGDSAGLDPGCYRGDAVPAPVRESLEAEAAEFYDRVRAGELEAVYEEAASIVRERRSREEFLEPIVRSVRSLGLPGKLETHQLYVLRFGDGYPYRKEVECSSGEGAPAVLMLTDLPVQASLVHRARAGEDLLYYSTLWSREDGVWRLSAFLVKVATIQGKDWQAFAEEAAAQKEKGNDRNAALLYNAAIDLLVANAWTRPGELAKLQLEQRRISVSNLPVNQVDPWAAGADTFRVYNSGYSVDAGQLALVFRYLSPHAMEDSVAVKEYAGRLHDFVVDNFPEYPEVFSRLILVAAEPGDQGRARINSFPLGPAP